MGQTARSRSWPCPTARSCATPKPPSCSPTSSARGPVTSSPVADEADSAMRRWRRPGATTGRGLGLEFLRHVERCSVLLHVVDCATIEPGRDPLTDLETIESELAAYGGLDDRPRLVALNKIDVPDAHELADMVRPEIE